MAAVTAIRDGLRTRLRTISGLRVPDRPAAEISPPSALVTGPAISYDSTMARGSDDFVFTIMLLVSKAWDRAAEDKLDGFLVGSGASSIKAKLEEAPADLGVAAIDFVRVVSVAPPAVFEFGENGIDYFGCEFTVNVTADGTA